MPSAERISAAEITAAVAAITDDLVAAYQDFHAHPELSMQEEQTAQRIERALAELGLSTQRIGGTGVVAVIENGPGPVLAYRADIDGLPISEDTGLDYASTARGTLPDGTETAVMHGCGHDAHIAVGLGTARVLVEQRAGWSGTVVMVFQPGEETGAGAAGMLADGLWEKVPQPVAVFGQHIMPAEAGTVQVTSGPALTMSDSYHVTVHGRQAHGSQPEAAIDPIVLGAFIITRLQTIVSREIPGSATAVLTIGVFRGGLKENIIPDSAEFTINIRTVDPQVRTTVLAAVERIIAAEAQASGAPAPTVEKTSEFPACYNDPDLVAELMPVLAETLGEDRVAACGPQTASEDFGALGDAIEVPHVFWFLGGYSAEKLAADPEPPGNHSPHFAPDDPATSLSTGVRAAVSVLVSRLDAPQG